MLNSFVPGRVGRGKNEKNDSLFFFFFLEYLGREGSAYFLHISPFQPKEVLHDFWGNGSIFAQAHGNFTSERIHKRILIKGTLSAKRVLPAGYLSLWHFCFICSVFVCEMY